MPNIMDARAFLILMGARKVGNYLYAWGGDAGEEPGLDCSGFVTSVLTEANRAWPGLYTGGRTTAAALYRWFDERGLPDIEATSDLTPGCIVFYHRGADARESIHHVALHVTNVPDMRLKQGLGNSFLAMPVGPIAFEAGGSGSAAINPRAALVQSATVRITASDEHGRGVTWVAKDPFVLLERAWAGEAEADQSATGEVSLLDVLAEETGIAAEELAESQGSVSPRAPRYNRRKEVEAVWRTDDLWPPLRAHPTDSLAFAILVAQYQRGHGFGPDEVDGMLGSDTYDHMRAHG